MKILLPLFLILFFASCATDTPPQIIGGPGLHTAVGIDDFAIDDPPLALPVLFRRENASFAMYEPADGTYIGAWLMPELTIRAFEELAGKKHAVYVNEINLGDEIPVEWILHCIAARATPLIIVYPPEDFNAPVLDLLTELAHRLGSFNLPMFITFFPGGESSGLMPSEYTILFRQARRIFHAHAPMAAFVWGAPCHTSTPQNPFYPGHAAVDWVALPMLAYWKPEKGFTDILANFEIFYHSFAEHKPIMALPLGISHFTRGDYTYRLDEAAAKIENAFAALSNFPRLGLVIYGDAFALGRTGTDDFSVSGDPALLEVYARAVADYLPSLERDTDQTSRPVRARGHGYYFENEIYIPHSTLENEWGISPPRRQRVINNETLAPSRRIPGKKITVCHERQVIFVE